MNAREITENVYLLGAVDWDRQLFDSLIPLPDGTSYNAYLIRGSEKTALIDTVEPEFAHVLLRQLEEVKQLDYIIANHAEQDHSGAIPQVLEKFPGAMVVTNARCQGMLIDLLEIPEDKFITVADGETLSLGDKTLEFIYTPWVHWPETISTYLQEDKILFSCDFFGSHVATSNLYVSDESRVAEAAKRYYAEIMMPFRAIIAKNLDKIEKYEIDLIAPSHGPIFNHPRYIIDAYRDWVSGSPKNSVVIPFISMHGSTLILVQRLVSRLVEAGITVQLFNLALTDIGKLAISLVDAATIVIGTPTVLVGPHPLALNAATLTNALRPKLKYASVIGSYGWGGKAVEQIVGAIPNLKVELIDPVLCKGHPGPDDLKAIDNLAAAIAEKHRDL